MAIRPPSQGLATADEIEAQQAALQAMLTGQAPSARGSVVQPMTAPDQEEEPATLQALLEKKMREGMARREQDIELQRMLQAKAAEMPQQADISGLFEMAKAAGAAPSAGAGYKAPTNVDPMDYFKNAAALEKNLGDEQMDYLKSQLALKAAKDKASAYDEHFTSARVQDLYKSMGTDVEKVVNNKADFDKNYSTVMAALQPDENNEVTLERVTQVLPLFIRGMGGLGAQSDREADRALINSAEMMVSTIKAKLDKGEKIDQSEVQNMRDTMAKAGESMQSATKSKIDNIDKFYLQNNKNRLVKAMADQGGRDYMDMTKKQLGISDSDQTKGGGMSLQERAREELKKLKAGKKNG